MASGGKAYARVLNRWRRSKRRRRKRRIKKRGGGGGERRVVVLVAVEHGTMVFGHPRDAGEHTTSARVRAHLGDPLKNERLYRHSTLFSR